MRITCTLLSFAALLAGTGAIAQPVIADASHVPAIGYSAIKPHLKR